MSEVQSQEPNKTSVMGYPVLTDAEIRSLFEFPDHGITKAEEIIRFNTF